MIVMHYVAHQVLVNSIDAHKRRLWKNCPQRWRKCVGQVMAVAQLQGQCLVFKGSPETDTLYSKVAQVASGDSLQCKQMLATRALYL